MKANSLPELLNHELEEGVS
jgi:ferritin-like metal-binding protein YciE